MVEETRPTQDGNGGSIEIFEAGVGGDVGSENA